MLIANQTIYLELQKTGSTHTRSILNQYFGDSAVMIGKHNTIAEVPDHIIGDISKKLFVGNIRNPWDWYVSLWSFGCQSRGGIYRKLTDSENQNKPWSLNKVLYYLTFKWIKDQDCKNWKRLYSDPNNYSNFNEWLKLIVLSDSTRLAQIYKYSAVNRDFGLFTDRFLWLYTKPGHIDHTENTVQNPIFITDYIIRNESIEEDLRKLIIKLDGDLVRFENILAHSPKRINQSKRDRDYRKYYTQESIDFVRTHESLIVNHFDYEF